MGMHKVALPAGRSRAEMGQARAAPQVVGSVAAVDPRVREFCEGNVYGQLCRVRRSKNAGRQRALLFVFNASG